MSQLSGFPTVRPAYILKLQVGEGQPVGTETSLPIAHVTGSQSNHVAVGETSSGSTFVHYVTPGGSISTVDGFSPSIDAEVVFAGDWLYFDPDQQHTRMNVKGVARTTEGEVSFKEAFNKTQLTNHQGINFAYSGVSGVSPDLGAIFQGQPKTIPFGLSTVNPTFEVGHPRLRLLENSTWVGNGRFLLDGDKLYVEVRISLVVASEDMD
ncbi:unnamed protein product [Penicillium egyptiacum]|uniref:Uncharacterized protein n=1 Tax=Penicillium egyptiacum TaxID=1303716 RepID=A0A9W4P7C5_9EURO|nr:unnamed protein product [Penicillium egyptiacum]